MARLPAISERTWGQVLIDYLRVGHNADGTHAAISGAGDVVGPASSVNDRPALFDGVTGKLLKVGAALTVGDVVGPASATDGVPALFDGTTGKLLKNSVPTGTGVPVLATSPTLVTPNIGVATGTSLALTDKLSLGGLSWLQGGFAGGNIIAAVSAAGAETGAFLASAYYFRSAAASSTGYWDGTNNQLSFGSGAGISWTAEPASAGGTRDLFLYRDGASILAQRNGTNAQKSRVANTFTSLSNMEYGGLEWVSNILELGAFTVGGTLRKVKLVGAGILTSAAILPTSDPSVAGQLWNNAGVVTVSS